LPPAFIPLAWFSLTSCKSGYRSFPENTKGSFFFPYM
jgi:hypothetical protein